MPDNRPTFGVEDAKVGTWDGDGTYSNVTDIWGIRTVTIEEQVTTADLEGDDLILATAAKVNSINVTLERASFGFEALEILTGQTVQSSSGGQGEYMHRTNRMGPYVGICSRSDEVETGGDVHFFIPKCRLVGGQTFTFQNGQFTTPSLQLRGVADSNVLDENSKASFYRVHQYPVTTTIALPPAL